MNKRFSTLLSGLLLTSAFASATPDVSKLQKVTFDKNLVTASTYFVVQEKDGNNDLSDGDQILGVKLTGDEKGLEYLAPVLSLGNLGEYNAYSYDWQVEIKSGVGGAKYYLLKNSKTGTYLTFSTATGQLVEVTADSKVNDIDVKNQRTSLFEADANGTAMTQGTTWYAKGVTSNNALTFEGVGQPNGREPGQVGLSGTPGAIYLCEYKKQPADLSIMNKTIAGEGFGLSFKDIKTYESNVIAETKKFKAFEVVNPIKQNMGNNIVHEIPAGTYLAVDYPETAIPNVIGSFEEFEACTFLAVDPAKNKKINGMDKEAGLGYEFSVIAASSMNYVEDITKDQANIEGQVYVGNACFDINILNYGAEVEDYKYEFLLKGFRYVNKDGKLVAKTGMAIGTVTSEGKSYIVTNAATSAAAFSLVNTSIYNPKGLLSTEDKPSIYTIQFVSGEDKEEKSEYGQYLTAGITSSSNFELFSTTEENVDNDPLYQFVITDIDTVKKEVTFANRQAEVSFTAVMYKEEGDLTFTVYPTNASNFNLSKIDKVNGVDKINFVQETLVAKKIQLAPVTVEDKFATFVTADDVKGLVRFELARTSEASDKLNVAAPRQKNQTTKEMELITGKMTIMEDAADLFELVKVKGTDKKDVIEYVENPYVFNKDGKKYTSLKRDTVAYNLYNIKLFAPEEETEYYVDGTSLVKSTATAYNRNFAIKKNLDGSVSLIYTKDVKESVAKYLAFKGVPEEGKDAWDEKEYYKLGTTYNVAKTFMVSEPEAISLEAKPQHISIEAVRGGFLSMNADKDGILAMNTADAEAMTLWVDTVKSDEVVPSFYIAKGGNFMYFAADSASNAFVGADRYKLEGGQTKLVFKAAELVSSDTLKTIVDGKEVLVAAKANAGKKIKGGLGNFQYQIIKDEEGSDEYVIRNVADGYKYVRVINNMLTLDADKKQAARFLIEPQSTPTANEGIATSEVKVLAGEGNVTIAGAAGKKVVVSNILGQVVANTVVSSDNAVIAAPAGVVVVAVEGEAAVKAIVK